MGIERRYGTSMEQLETIFINKKKNKKIHEQGYDDSTRVR